LNCSGRIIVTALAAITINNATSEILNRLDFFISVSELITASYGRHDKESAENVSVMVRSMNLTNARYHPRLPPHKKALTEYFVI